MSQHPPSQQKWLHQFAELHWYEATITFLFNAVAKTSELLLTAGIVVSTANFLTNGQILRTNQSLSMAWSWAQAIAIDASLGVVCRNTLHSWQQRAYVRAIFLLLLTLLLSVVAGLMTHFEALAQAAGLAVTDKGASGMLPLWVMSALRAVAVIGLLVASRLSPVPLHTQRQEQRTGESPLPSASTKTPARSRAEKQEKSNASSRDQEALIAVLLLRLQQAGITSSEHIKEAQRSQTVPAAPTGNRPRTTPEPVLPKQVGEARMPPFAPLVRAEQSGSYREPGSSFLPEEPELPTSSRPDTGNPHHPSPEPARRHEETRLTTEEHHTLSSTGNLSTEEPSAHTHNGHAHQSVPALERFLVLDQTLKTHPTPLAVSPLQRAEPQRHAIPRAQERDAQRMEPTTGNQPGTLPELLISHDEPDASSQGDQQFATPSIRLQTAYLALQAEGKRVSGTALASRAGVRKQTALDWLQRQKPVRSAPPQS